MLRHYTQNIDGLESLAGVEDENIVAAHGSFGTASCIRLVLLTCADSLMIRDSRKNTLMGLNFRAFLIVLSNQNKTCFRTIFFYYVLLNLP